MLCKYNTNINFTFKDGTTLRYKLKKCYLECLDGSNAALFSKIGVDKYEYCKRFYTCSGIGSWPEFTDEDYSWIDSMIDALYDEYKVTTTVGGACRYHSVSPGDKITIKYRGYTYSGELYGNFVNIYEEYNDVIFTNMGLNKEIASRTAYGYVSDNADEDNQWPESKNFPDLLKMLKYLSSKGATVIIGGVSLPVGSAEEDKKTVSITVKKKHSITLNYN